ncbi:type II secretion system protein GspK [Phycisphaerales bacterium AB-hyl4]|uniref:Type II secretion system protein GspK n=1 Tax=Natronomicrosphaera hydrolytica TaxID=3242702 RepID=A0ABV4TZG2_9BACT
MMNGRTKCGRGGCHRERGAVMIVAVLILLVVTATALLLATTMRVEVRAAANQVEAMAAANAAEGAVRHVMAVLAREPGQMPAAGELPSEGVIVGDAAYWLIRPAGEGRAGYVAGITDEASKLHLNVATVEMLGQLRGVGRTRAEDVVAWRTPEEQAMDLPGAGAEHYLMLDPPYLPKHGPLESVEELLLVRGWTPERLFELADFGDTTGMDFENVIEPDRPLYELFTVYSYAARADAINVNASDERDALRELLETELSAERFSLVWSELGFGGGGGGRGGSGGPTFESMLDFYRRSGLTGEEFDALAARLTTDETAASAGRVNVNTASEPVLAALPGMDEASAAALVDARAGRDASEGGLAWVVDAVGDDRLFEAGPYLTDRAQQFTVDVVAIGATGRAFKRYRVVIDMAGDRPRVVRFDDWTERGWPLDPALREALRSGVSLEEAVALYGRLDR